MVSCRNQSKKGLQKLIVKTLPDNALIASPNAVNAPAYHRHLVRPGLATSYMIRLQNIEAQPVTVDLTLSDAPAGWSAKLEKNNLRLEPGTSAKVVLSVSPSADVPIGSQVSVTVKAKTSSGNPRK